VGDAEHDRAATESRPYASIANNKFISNNMKTIKNIIITFTALASFAPAMAQKYVGGDISMLPYYEQKGATYYNHEGTAYADALNLFKAEG
jgi:arabinogalactan endo-1,4-beta-galactosidase